MNLTTDDRPAYRTKQALHEAAKLLSIKAAELQVADQQPEVVQVLIDTIQQLN